MPQCWPAVTRLTSTHPAKTNDSSFSRYAHLKDDALRQAADLAADIINDAINQNCITIDPLAQKLNNG